MAFILSEYEECPCFQKHRPIKKVKRSPTIIIGGLLLNAAIVASFYMGLIDNLFNTDSSWLNRSMVLVCIFFFLCSATFFLASIYVEPGYLVPKFDFLELIDNFLENNIHLENLCVYCQVIITENSFHCTICNRCSDNYDHHCPFINNCLGTRNHKYFLLFLLSYSIYTVLVLGCAAYRIYNVVIDNYDEA